MTYLIVVVASTPLASMQLVDDAEGRIQFTSESKDDDILTLVRDNTAGAVFLWLTRYQYAGTPTSIPATEGGSLKRKFRLRCEVRSIGADQTFLVILKALDAPPGSYLAERRQRLLANQDWLPTDLYISPDVISPCRFRLVHRSLSAAPARLLVRNLLITEYDAPRSLTVDST
jgi:hypothetical protein